jgi:hypothetical protein
MMVRLWKSIFAPEFKSVFVSFAVDVIVGLTLFVLITGASVGLFSLASYLVASGLNEKMAYLLRLLASILFIADCALFISFMIRMTLAQIKDLFAKEAIHEDSSDD